MNKQLVLYYLRLSLLMEEDGLDYYKREAAYFWDLCDKNQAEETKDFYINYKYFKNKERKAKAKMKALRDNIRLIKKMK